MHNENIVRALLLFVVVGSAMSGSPFYGRILCVFMFLFVDFMDTSGTLLSMAEFAGLLDPVTVRLRDLDGSLPAREPRRLPRTLSGTLARLSLLAVHPQGTFEGQYTAFLVDGFATTIGALCGTSPVTTYIESAPGILEGGRTGITAIVVSICFLISCLFAPILASIVEKGAIDEATDAQMKEIFTKFTADFSA